MYIKITAIIAAVLLLASIGGMIYFHTDRTPEAPEDSTPSVTETATQAPVTAAPVSEAPSITPATAAPTEAPTEAPQQDDEPAKEDKPDETPTEAPTEAPKDNAPSVPGTPADTIAAFNNATAKAAESAAFTLKKTTVLGAYDIQGESLETLKKLGGALYESIAKDTISGTLNCGEETKTAQKGGGSELLLAANLTEADIKTASATAAGDGIDITIDLADSANPGGGNTAIDHATMHFLTPDDLKIYGPQNDLTVNGTDASVIDCKITASVNGSGELTAMKISYTYKGSLSDCTYKFLGKYYGGLSGSGEITCTVEYSGFSY